MRVRKPILTEAQILAWADAYHRRRGHWPGSKSGIVRNASPLTWNAVDRALQSGRRGLAGGGSLARLLERHRGVCRYLHHRPLLTIRQILSWAEAHKRRTGLWPTSRSGAVRNAPGEKWKAIDLALRKGGRGLPGGVGLARLLAERCGRKDPNAPRPL